MYKIRWVGLEEMDRNNWDGLDLPAARAETNESMDWVGWFELGGIR